MKARKKKQRIEKRIGLYLTEHYTTILPHIARSKKETSYSFCCWTLPCVSFLHSTKQTRKKNERGKWRREVGGPPLFLPKTTKKTRIVLAGMWKVSPVLPYPLLSWSLFYFIQDCICHISYISEVNIEKEPKDNRSNAIKAYFKIHYIKTPSKRKGEKKY